MRRHGASAIGKLANREIGREEAAKRLNESIFLDDSEFNQATNSHGPTFDIADFERRYRMPREIYNRIRAEIIVKETFFLEGKDFTRKKSASDQRLPQL